MPRIQFTPWKEESELLRVRDQFYGLRAGAKTDLRSKACALVWVWKARGNLPHPVEATALLIDAILHDDPSKNSIFSIRATYSAAFCRFVTGLVDSKLYGPRMTMYQKAMTLGLPASFVELRHEATHRELPSLSVFREATRRSLDWLWDFYWAGLRVAEGTERLSQEQILDMLQPLLGRHQELKGAGSKKRPVKGSLLSEDALSALAGSVSNLITVLVRQGVLIPASSENIKRVFSVWDETLRSLCLASRFFLTNLIDAFGETLLLRNSTSEESFCESVFLWMQHILTSKAWLTMRRIYLSVAYVDVLCEKTNSSWAGRVKRLLQNLAKEEEDDIMAVSVCFPEQTASSVIIDDEDNFGWKVAEDWAPKPIGAFERKETSGLI
ncbi:cell morphogenesis protein Las1 [Ascosphaera apis ARSEF 7405]|uniref:Cell morphogenesis protein Las1 n=1 Tax=Ascosphaera apis ARSEF 7405 TaxID=392613 RepID=A0A167Y8G3_9EURO|nr:cell morphogenesis protein Las1 [Ascosphaera apis ARSEF 7405]